MIKIQKSDNIIASRRVYAGIDTKRFNPVYAKQNSPNACWAACLEMVCKYYGVNVSQEEFLKNHCGIDFWGNSCDCAAQADIITENLNQCTITHCIKTPVYHSKPKPNVLFDLLRQNKPIVLAYNLGNPVGHAVILTAISYDDTILGDELHSIIVRDPSPSEKFNNGLVEYTNPQNLLNNVHAWWVPSITKPQISLIEDYWS